MKNKTTEQFTYIICENDFSLAISKLSDMLGDSIGYFRLKRPNGVIITIDKNTKKCQKLREEAKNQSKSKSPPVKANVKIVARRQQG